MTDIIKYKEGNNEIDKELSDYQKKIAVLSKEFTIKIKKLQMIENELNLPTNDIEILKENLSREIEKIQNDLHSTAKDMELFVNIISNVRMQLCKFRVSNNELKANYDELLEKLKQYSMVL